MLMLLCLSLLSFSMFSNLCLSAQEDTAAIQESRDWSDKIEEDVSHHLSLGRSARTINKSQLSRIFQTRIQEIPDELSGIIGALNSAMDLLKCLPSKKDGSCYIPDRYCKVKTDDFTVEAKLEICKNPWTLKIHFKIPKEFKDDIPSFLNVDVDPIVLKLDHRNSDGMTKIVSNSRVALAEVALIGFDAAKVYFKFDLLVRWDCTKPSDNSAKRYKYNTEYDDGKPGNDMNKLYYKLKIDYKFKVKNWVCLFLCYRCEKCETLIDKQGHFAEGPEACKWS